jgi:hypothetical protein
VNPKKFQKLEKIIQISSAILAGSVSGSTLSSRTHSESELGLAVWPRDETARERKPDILADLVQHGFDPADLVFLDPADIMLHYEAVKHKRLVYEVEGFDRGSTNFSGHTPVSVFSSDS